MPIPAAALQVAADQVAITQAEEALNNALAAAENGGGDPALIDQLGLALCAAIQQYNSDMETLTNLCGTTEVLLARVWRPNADNVKKADFIDPFLIFPNPGNVGTVKAEARVWGDLSVAKGYFELVQLGPNGGPKGTAEFDFPDPCGWAFPLPAVVKASIDLRTRSRVALA